MVGNCRVNSLATRGTPLLSQEAVQVIQKTPMSAFFGGSKRLGGVPIVVCGPNVRRKIFAHFSYPYYLDRLLSQEGSLRAWRAGGVVPKRHPARLRPRTTRLAALGTPPNLGGELPSLPIHSHFHRFQFSNRF